MRRRLPAVLSGLALSGLALIAGGTAKGDDLVIQSAAAVRPALLQLPAMVAPQIRVTVQFGNASAISKRVAGGERVDIVILPPQQLAPLIDRGLLAAEGRSNLGVVRLGVAVRAGSPPLTVDTEDAFRAALLAAAAFGMPDPADGSTSSQHLVKVLARLGIADAMRDKTRLFKDGTAALHALANGAISLTVAPMTSIRVVTGVALAGPLPDALQSTTVYAAALSRQAAAPARALMAVLTAPAFAAVLRERGIDPPPQ